MHPLWLVYTLKSQENDVKDPVHPKKEKKMMKDSVSTLIEDD